jgi:hypothetical protein
VAEVAEMLGRPLMPWQRLVVDVALELDPAKASAQYPQGLPAFREIRITVPRQQGKSTLTLPVMVHRANGFPHREVVLGRDAGLAPQNIAYTAQTGTDARKKWRDEHVKVIRRSPLRELVEAVRLSSGDEHIRWRTGSMHSVLYPSETGGHGQTLDLPVIDEAFSLDEAVEQATGPAMVTRPAAQTLLVSTAGTTRDRWWRAKTEEGRALAELDVRSGVAYFEWSAADDADPGDPAMWFGCMPALGRTVDVATIRSEFERLKLPVFRRAYLNQWVDGQMDSVIPLERWDVAADPAAGPAQGAVFAVAVTADRSWASISVAAPGPVPHVELVERAPGTGWVVERMAEVCARWQARAVVLDAAGPEASLAGELERRCTAEVRRLTAREMVLAAGSLHDAVVTGALTHGGAETERKQLRDALEHAQRQTVTGAWRWARDAGRVDVCPLIAATMAHWVLSELPVQPKHDVRKMIW